MNETFVSARFQQEEGTQTDRKSTVWGDAMGPARGLIHRRLHPDPPMLWLQFSCFTEQLWELGLKPICISVAAQEKPRHAQDLRTELPLQNVLYPPSLLLPWLMVGFQPLRAVEQAQREMPSAAGRGKTPTDGKGQGLQGFGLHLQERAVVALTCLSTSSILFCT